MNMLFSRAENKVYPKSQNEANKKGQGDYVKMREVSRDRMIKLYTTSVMPRKTEFNFENCLFQSMSNITNGKNQPISTGSDKNFPKK